MRKVINKGYLESLDCSNLVGFIDLVRYISGEEPEGEQVPGVESELVSLSVSFGEFRILKEEKYSVSIRLKDGVYWILVDNQDTPKLSYQDVEDIKYYVDNLGDYKSPELFRAFSEDGEKLYDVDAKNLTCSCYGFKYKYSHYSKDKEEHLCKHLSVVTRMYPEYLPKSIKEADSKPIGDPDGKTRYPIEMMDLYIDDIRATMRNFGVKYEICGSVRRRAKMVSDLDILVQTDSETWNKILDYFENMMGYELIPNIGRGEKKAAYMVDGYVHVDFKLINEENWPFALLHFTGSKNTNIKMRSKASKMGLRLNEYGLYRESDDLFVGDGIKTEKDIFDKLGLPYLEPWER